MSTYSSIEFLPHFKSWGSICRRCVLGFSLSVKVRVKSYARVIQYGLLTM